jgi:hypothetical protein
MYHPELSKKDIEVRNNRKSICLMVFYATFNNISVIVWQSVLLLKETTIPGENHRPVASH